MKRDPLQVHRMPKGLAGKRRRDSAQKMDGPHNRGDVPAAKKGTEPDRNVRASAGALSAYGETVAAQILEAFDRKARLQRFDQATMRCANEALAYAVATEEAWRRQLADLEPFRPFGPFDIGAVQYESRRAYIRERVRYYQEAVRQAKFEVAAAVTRQRIQKW